MDFTYNMLHIGRHLKYMIATYVYLLQIQNLIECHWAHLMYWNYASTTPVPTAACYLYGASLKYDCDHCVWSSVYAKGSSPLWVYRIILLTHVDQWLACIGHEYTHPKHKNITRTIELMGWQRYLYLIVGGKSLSAHITARYPPPPSPKKY